jgi:hypothetical protein
MFRAYVAELPPRMCSPEYMDAEHGVRRGWPRLAGSFGRASDELFALRISTDPGNCVSGCPDYFQHGARVSGAEQGSDSGSPLLVFFRLLRRRPITLRPSMLYS